MTPASSSMPRFKPLRMVWALAWLCCAGNSLACDCVTFSFADRVLGSQGVFLGEVLRHTPLVSVEFRVLEPFKGARQESVTIVTGRSLCDYFLRSQDAQPGDRFLVFMSTGATGNTVNRCFGSALAAVAAAELKILRRGTFK